MKTKTSKCAFLLFLVTLFIAGQMRPAHCSPDTLWLGSGSVSDTPAPSATNGPRYQFLFASPTGAVCTLGNQLVAHAETTTISGTNYYTSKKILADGSGTELTQTSATATADTARKLFGKFVFPLTGLASIPAGTWTFYYRQYYSVGGGGSFGSGHYDVDILIRQSDGTIRQTIATNVATSGALTTTYSTVSGTYSFGGYTIVADSDYLEIDYYVDYTSCRKVTFYLRIDDNTLAVADQTRANIPTPIYWYTQKYTGTLSAGTHTLTIYYRASSASATVSIDKTAPDGTLVSAIGSTTWNPTDSATITSTTVSISGSATSFTDERLRLKIDCTSGVLAVYFDGSSQPSKLDTPTGTPPIPEFPSTEFQIAILIINLLIVTYLLRRKKKSTRN